MAQLRSHRRWGKDFQYWCGPCCCGRMFPWQIPQMAADVRAVASPVTDVAEERGAPAATADPRHHEAGVTDPAAVAPVAVTGTVRVATMIETAADRVGTVTTTAIIVDPVVGTTTGATPDVVMMITVDSVVVTMITVGPGVATTIARAADRDGTEIAIETAVATGAETMIVASRGARRVAADVTGIAVRAATTRVVTADAVAGTRAVDVTSVAPIVADTSPTGPGEIVGPGVTTIGERPGTMPAPRLGDADATPMSRWHRWTSTRTHCRPR